MDKVTASGENIGRMPDRFTFRYIFADDYNPVYVNGAYGGITPKKEIVAHFFLERHAVPRSVTHEVDDEGMIGAEVETEPEVREMLVRFVPSGVVLSLDGAKQIRDWLDRQIDRLEQQSAGEMEAAEE
ncbi:MAG: hypothetical protein ACOC7S_00280 [Planctomycetota bacterium]